MDKRIVNLEVNDSGAWRRVTCFDIDCFQDGSIEYAAANLLEMSANPRLKGRLIIPGDEVPLMTWKRDTGWKHWAPKKWDGLVETSTTHGVAA